MENKKNFFSGILFPVIILSLILTSTGTLYYYENKINNENKTLSDDIAKAKETIKEIKKDENLQIYDILSKNEQTINKLNSYSQITRFIKGFDYIEKKYKLSLEWFDYSKWIINTQTTVSFLSSDSSYLATADFIKKYRADEKVDFKLPFISNFKSYWALEKRNMKFNIKLEVKDDLFKEEIKLDTNKKEIIK